MRITRNQLRRLIAEAIVSEVDESSGREKSFEMDVYGTNVKTTLRFISSETPYDQTITKLQIMPSNEEFEDVEFYGSMIDDIADEVISYLEPDTSENFDYWFLDGDNEDLEQEFKSLVISALESIGVDPESQSDDRNSYRDREHNSY